MTVRRLAWIASASGILVAETVPWSNFRTHPHRANVCWIPFRDYTGAGSLVDFCQNIGFTLPFGLTGILTMSSRTVIVLSAFLLMAWMGAAIGLRWKSNR